MGRASDLVAASLAGAAATVIMSQFGRAVACAVAAAGTPPEELQREMPQTPQGERPTERLAAAIAETAAARPLCERQKERGAAMIHYAMGTALGALYGPLRSRGSWLAAGRGALYGAAIWLAVSEAVMPALRLSQRPAARTRRSQLMDLGAHLAYGLGLDALLRLR